MKLKEYQVEHSKSIFKSLMNHKLAIDLSPLGSGKTYTAIGIATLNCFECVIIVCPKSVIPKWTQLSIENDIQHKSMIMTPCKFTKQSFKFEKTRTLLIVDEFQSLKNKSKQSKKVYDAVEEYNLYFLGISGTPFDKPKQLKRFKTHFKLKDSINNYSFSMGKSNQENNVVLKNLYIPVAPEYKQDVEWYITVLKVLSTSDEPGELFKILRQLENTKVIQIYYKILECLQRPGKCVVMLNYLSSIDMLVELLQNHFQVLCLFGKHNLKERETILNNFQTDISKRILIGNLKVLSTGIDLDDKFGNQPRTVFISPNFYTVEMYQATKRFQRMDSKSSASVNFVWYLDNNEEKIIKSMQHKSEYLNHINNDLSGLLLNKNILNYFQKVLKI